MSVRWYPGEANYVAPTADVQDVYQSPEFQAFCKRFGIAWDLRTKRMVITLEADSVMTILQEYQATDEKSG